MLLIPACLTHLYAPIYDPYLTLYSIHLHAHHLYLICIACIRFRASLITLSVKSVFPSISGQVLSGLLNSVIFLPLSARMFPLVLSQ